MKRGLGIPMFIFLALLNQQTSHAEENETINSTIEPVKRRHFPPLENSMSYASVLKLWGPPDFKEERETKREELWKYGKREIKFAEGKLTGFIVEDFGQDEVEQSDEMNSSGRSLHVDLESSEDELVLSEILEDILDEPKSKADSKTEPELTIESLLNRKKERPAYQKMGHNKKKNKL